MRLLIFMLMAAAIPALYGADGECVRLKQPGARGDLLSWSAAEKCWVAYDPAPLDRNRLAVVLAQREFCQSQLVAYQKRAEACWQDETSRGLEAGLVKLYETAADICRRRGMGFDPVTADCGGVLPQEKK